MSYDDDSGFSLGSLFKWVVTGVVGLLLFRLIFGGSGERRSSSLPHQSGSTEETVRSSPAFGQWLQFQRSSPSASVSYANPVQGQASVTGLIGQRMDPFSGQPAFHKGIDLAASGNPDILAAAAGVVLFVGDQKDGYGNKVILGHADGSYTLYAHMTGGKAPAVGTLVQQGAVIGAMGSTGKSTGDHLHFEAHRGGQLLNPAIQGRALRHNDRVSTAPLPADVTNAVAQASGNVDKLPVVDGQPNGRPLAVAAGSASLGAVLPRG